eukprot:scaffold19530_cov60-Phaeocystis_antarctica.AAC.5
MLNTVSFHSPQLLISPCNSPPDTTRDREYSAEPHRKSQPYEPYEAKREGMVNEDAGQELKRIGAPQARAYRTSCPGSVAESVLSHWL